MRAGIYFFKGARMTCGEVGEDKRTWWKGGLAHAKAVLYTKRYNAVGDHESNSSKALAP